MKRPLVMQDRAHPFAEDVVVGYSGVLDPHLSVLAKVSSLVHLLVLGAATCW